MPIRSTQELFLHELAEIYDAEHWLLEGQQEMVQKATEGNLQSAIQRHIRETEQHIRNLEQVFRELAREPQRGTSEVAQGLVSEARQSIQEVQGDDLQGYALRDCAINAAVIKVEHFEIACYRGMVTGARLQAQTEVVNLLEANLRQEEKTAETAEQSMEELLQTAQQAQERGPIAKAKDKLEDKLKGQ